MLNTEKLLYILPDLTYLAELLPGKKKHSYTIQSFRQINGDFINDNEFISNNIQKLFTKIDKEEYHLILPDFLFTNTIVNIDDDNADSAVKYVKEKLLPDLNLKNDTHEIEVTVLTSFKGKSKVQISAIEKELLSPIRVAAKKSDIKIKAISPLSWAVKSIVSLEPSITVLQLGNNLYSSQHYIGIDQTNNFPLDEFTAITETIKTLKGAEPSIQTIYLASSSLIEEKLKKDLSGTLPIQQLATYKEDDSKIPSYVKFIIESCMRTISISDFPVPKFSLGKATKSEENKLSAAAPKKEETKETKTEEIPSKDLVKDSPSDLPEPSKVPITPEKTEVVVEKVAPMIEDKKVDTQDINKEETKAITEKPKIEEAKIELVDPVIIKTDISETEKETSTDEVTPEPKKLEEVVTTVKTQPETTPKPEPESIPEPVEAINKDKVNVEVRDGDLGQEEKEGINLSQFAGKEEETKEIKEENKKTDNIDKKDDKSVANLKTKPNKVIKNSSGINNMLKMVFITLAVFFITIAIGIGVGLGLLKMSDKSPEEEIVPIVETQPEATPEPTPTPEPVEEINKEELSILVVNATTKAGYAGKIKALIIDGEIEDVIAGNSEGDYEDGTDYILMTDENSAIQELIEESTELEFEYSSDVDIEDPDGDYDVVIVLAK